MEEKAPQSHPSKSFYHGATAFQPLPEETEIVDLGTLATRTTV